MKIRVNFTLEIPPHHLPQLRQLAEADTTGDAAWFVRAEAEDTIKGYLGDNGVNSKTIQA